MPTFSVIALLPTSTVCLPLCWEQPESKSQPHYWELQTYSDTYSFSFPQDEVHLWTPKSIHKCTRLHNIAGHFYSFKELTKPFSLPGLLWPYRNRKGFLTFPWQKDGNVIQIHSWDKRANVQNKKQWLHAKSCYKTISVQVTLKGWRHRITKRTQKQCGNSILKSSNATSSGSFHH